MKLCTIDWNLFWEKERLVEEGAFFICIAD